MARLGVYVPDELARLAREYRFNVSALTQRAITEEIRRMTATKTVPDLDAWIGASATIAVEVQSHRDAPTRSAEFQGSWVIDPDEDIRGTAPGADLGVLWGVAVTVKGRFAVYSRHVNHDGGRLLDFNTLDDAVSAMPADVAEELRGRLFGVEVLDI